MLVSGYDTFISYVGPYLESSSEFSCINLSIKEQVECRKNLKVEEREIDISQFIRNLDLPQELLPKEVKNL